MGNPVPGAKAVAPDVPLTKGGDNSVQEFGTEGEATPRTQAVANATAYIASFSAQDWAEACSLASGEYRQQLAQLIANAKVKGNGEKPEGCAATLEALFGKAPKGALDAFRIEEVLSFRVRGDGYAYLIYKSTGGQTMFIAMAEDGGEWKVNVFQPQPFATGP